jgi:hypothetical protein
MAQRQDFRWIGLLLLSSSSVQERDFCRVLPEDYHAARSANAVEQRRGGVDAADRSGNRDREPKAG